MPLMELSHTGRWYANGFISAYNFCEQYEKEHPSAKVDFALYADNLEQKMKCNHFQIMNSTRTTSSMLDE